MPIRSDNPIGRTPIVKVGQGRALRRWMESCALFRPRTFPNRVTDDFSIDFIGAARTNQRSMVMFLPLPARSVGNCVSGLQKKVGEIKRKEGMEGEGGKLRHAAIHTRRSNRLLQGELPFPDIALRGHHGRISSNRGLFSHLSGMKDGRNGPNLIFTLL